MTTTETARFTLQPNGDVTIELSASATAEEEALAVAIADELCAAANGVGDEEDEGDEDADDITGFMRKRAAEVPKPEQPKERLPPQKQLVLLDHLDDLAFQGTFWE